MHNAHSKPNPSARPQRIGIKIKTIGDRPVLIGTIHVPAHDSDMIRIVLPKKGKSRHD